MALAGEQMFGAFASVLLNTVAPAVPPGPP